MKLPAQARVHSPGSAEHNLTVILIEYAPSPTAGSGYVVVFSDGSMAWYMIESLRLSYETLTALNEEWKRVNA